MLVITRATARERARFGLRRDAPGRGPAPPDGSLDLPSAARFDPGSTDCVADIRPLIRTIRKSDYFLQSSRMFRKTPTIDTQSVERI
jgi:hypothetical protein